MKQQPITVTPVLIQAARLQVTINDRLGVPTDPVIRELAAKKTTTPPRPYTF